MSLRRSLSVPIVLAIVMIALLVVLTVGWVLVNVTNALKDTSLSGLYWALLSIGSSFILLLVVGVVLYLILSIKAINLTRRQSNFIDSVTHELKSPIASMKLYLQTLSRHHVDQQLAADFHRFMLEDLERLDHLINQMLEAGRLEAERSDGEQEDVDLAKLLGECAAAVCMSYRVPSQIIRLELQPSIVFGRRIDLDVIFRNLIDNAVKYAGAAPQVEVSLCPSGRDKVLVRIADNGRGIPPHLRRKIFGRFVRLGSELEREKPGTGLGLYIVRTLVRRHRGSIRVRDREKGPGSVFEVLLPGRELCAENAALSPAETGQDEVASPLPPGEG
jgi:signal transduction histidine kinase